MAAIMSDREILAVSALLEILADVDAPGHTIRNISAGSIMAARAAVKLYENETKEPERT